MVTEPFIIINNIPFRQPNMTEMLRIGCNSTKPSSQHAVCVLGVHMPRPIMFEQLQKKIEEMNSCPLNMFFIL